MTPQYDVALNDIVSGITNWRMWGRLGWQETKRRYRRTIIGPFWTTLSLSIFILTLGIIWAQLWKQDPKAYLPFLTAGMLAWGLVSTIITEGCASFITAESLIKSIPFSYTVLPCAVVWRNMIVFLHNIAIFIGVMLYAGIEVTVNSLMVVPGLFFVSINGIWVAALLGMMCSRFRDIQQIVISLLQISMFVTPIFWKPEQLGARSAIFVDINPLYHYVDVVRSPLLGHAPSLLSWEVVAAGTVVGWAVTLFCYSRFRRRLPYWI
jgi:ABC-type polysaccharide/polyol phosphate export permease